MGAKKKSGTGNALDTFIRYRVSSIRWKADDRVIGSKRKCDIINKEEIDNKNIIPSLFFNTNLSLLPWYYCHIF